MAAPFATAAALAKRMRRDVWSDPYELAQVEQLLIDASEHLRGIIGWQVSPPVTVSTFVHGVAGPWLHLPGAPVTSATATAADGTTVLTGFQPVDGALYRAAGWPDGITVKYQVGYATPPADLLAWTCVLASQVLVAFESSGALGTSGLSYVALDDFRAGWQDGDTGGFSLPVRVEEQLRARYGSGVYVTGGRG